MSFSDISIQELASAFMVLFAVIDITGAVPIINDIQNNGRKISAIKAALALRSGSRNDLRDSYFQK